jgi:hypothetical protein
MCPRASRSRSRSRSRRSKLKLPANMGRSNVISSTCPLSSFSPKTTQGFAHACTLPSRSRSQRCALSAATFRTSSMESRRSFSTGCVLCMRTSQSMPTSRMVARPLRSAISSVPDGAPHRSLHQRQLTRRQIHTLADLIRVKELTCLQFFRWRISSAQKEQLNCRQIPPGGPRPGKGAHAFTAPAGGPHPGKGAHACTALAGGPHPGEGARACNTPWRTSFG